MLLAVFITIIISVSSLMFKNSKLVTIFFFIFIWILFGWNYWNGDYEAYETRYNSLIIGLITDGYEFGYSGLMLLSKLMGYDFQEFLIGIGFCSLLFFFNFIIHYSNYPALFTLAFFLFFFPLHYVLLRNFIAFTIVLQGLIFVINNHKHKLLLFSLCVLVASLIHSTSIFYFGFLWCFGKRKINISLISILVFITALLLIKYVAILINVLFSSSGRIDFYDSSAKLVVYNISFQILSLLVVNLFYNISLYLTMSSDTERRFNLIIMNINIFLLFLIPLYYFYNIAFRLFWNIALINIIFFINIYMRYNGKIKFWLFFLIMIYLLMFFLYLILPYINDTLCSLYKFNLIFNYKF